MHIVLVTYALIKVRVGWESNSWKTGGSCKDIRHQFVLWS